MRTPSQPSPYSAELQAFILTKYDPLLTIVRELNDRVEVAEKERFRLGRRLEYLEECVKKLQIGAAETPGGDGAAAADALMREELKQPPPEVTASEGQLASPWLFSCQAATPTSSLQALLEYTPDQTQELDVRQWASEEDMWVAFLEELPRSIPITRPESLSLPHLRACVRPAIMEMCKNEVLLILRQVPGKEAAATLRQSITFVAIIAAAISEGWSRVEAVDPTSLGRLALVLEGDGLGTRLRAGRNRFVIEPLN